MYIRTAISLILLLGHCVVQAAEVRPHQWRLGLAAGQGLLENPLAGHQDGRTSLLPSFSYYGKRFFISNLTAGYSLVEKEHFYLDLVARPNEDGLYYRMDAATSSASLSSFMTLFQAPEVSDIDRRVSLMAGPSATLVSEWVDLSLSWYHDVTAVHHGTETHLRLDKSYPLLGGSVGFGIGAIRKDTNLAGYYYHFSEREAGVFASRYADSFPPGDVTDRYGRLHFAYPLGNNFELRLAARYTNFDLDGRNPRFIEQPETLSWFAGVQYTLGN